MHPTNVLPPTMASSDPFSCDRAIFRPSASTSDKSRVSPRRPSPPRYHNLPPPDHRPPPVPPSLTMGVRNLRLNCGGNILDRPKPDEVFETPPALSSPNSPSISGQIHFNIQNAPPSPSPCSIQLTLGVQQCKPPCAKRASNYPFTLVVSDAANTPNIQVSSSMSINGATFHPTLRTSVSWCDEATRPLVRQTSEPGPDEATDLDCIVRSRERLEASGFYYQGLSWQEAIKRLERRPEGTFLVRDSQDPRFLFSISVQTPKGPTSVRIHYARGLFYLDAERKASASLPKFRCVLELIDYYIALNGTLRGKSHVWLDRNGQTVSCIRLTRPLRESAPSLQHVCRLAVNRRLNASHASQFPPVSLPTKLKLFLMEYPYLN